MFNLNGTDPSWHNCLTQALKKVDQNYLQSLIVQEDWLPGKDKIFNAFTLPVSKIKYVLIGESPYPRTKSANGYAFWDAAVTDLWSESGLSKSVNRATSLRNILKMLLIAEGVLKPYHTSQQDIAKLNKEKFVQTNTELFNNLFHHGFLLLNASLVLRTSVSKDAYSWRPFIQYVLTYLFEKNPTIQLILFGNIANIINKIINHSSHRLLYAEHPYNISFINNPQVIEFFRPLHLLVRDVQKI